MLRRAVLHNKFAFYDLVLATPSHPSQPIESKELLESIKKKHAESRLAGAPRVFEGNYKLDKQTAEERINRIFGGRIKGDSPISSSRILRGEPKTIAGVKVPSKPTEPDNCCMSGCINCVWEMFNDDIKDWNAKRKEAATSLKSKGGRWPEDFDAPVQFLAKENLPKSLADDPSKAQVSEHKSGWGNVPVSIRVFAEFEKSLKEKRRSQQQSQQQTSP